MRTATVIQIAEGVPATRPSFGVEGVDDALIWERLDAYLALRWGTRDCTMAIEGPGYFAEPLNPFTPTLWEVWHSGSGWTAFTPEAGPLGPELSGFGPYRVSGTLGSADAPPAAVLEAGKRLGEYWAQSASQESAATIEWKDGDFAQRFISHWKAKALQLSGAADLLRPWRRA